MITRQQRSRIESDSEERASPVAGRHPRTAAIRRSTVSLWVVVVLVQPVVRVRTLEELVGLPQELTLPTDQQQLFALLAEAALAGVLPLETWRSLVALGAREHPITMGAARERRERSIPLALRAAACPTLPHWVGPVVVGAAQAWPRLVVTEAPAGRPEEVEEVVAPP